MLPVIFAVLFSTACGSMAEQGDLTVPPGSLDQNLTTSTPDSVFLRLSFSKLKDLQGQVCLSVFDNGDKFPEDASAAVLAQCFPLDAGAPVLSAITANRPHGIAAFHDRNSNGVLDKKKFGPMEIPAEGFGFSRNPPFRPGTPEWKDVQFSLAPGTHTMDIEFTYLD